MGISRLGGEVVREVEEEVEEDEASLDAVVREDGSVAGTTTTTMDLLTKMDMLS